MIHIRDFHSPEVKSRPQRGMEEMRRGSNEEKRYVGMNCISLYCICGEQLYISISNLLLQCDFKRNFNFYTSFSNTQKQNLNHDVIFGQQALSLTCGGYDL